MSAPRSGGTGFDPGPRHTKVVNNGTGCSPLDTRIFGVGLGLVAPVLKVYDYLDWPKRTQNYLALSKFYNSKLTNYQISMGISYHFHLKNSLTKSLILLKTVTFS